MGWELKSRTLTFTSITTMDLQDSAIVLTNGGSHYIGISDWGFPIRLMILDRLMFGFAMRWMPAN